MSYQIFILRSAQKSLAALPAEIYEKVRDAIREMAKAPRPVGCKKLTGRNACRIRVNDYRIIYEIDEKSKIVTVLSIGHRRNVYR